uniref:Uncharacterized protein n=1 Tax=Rhizophora mucronata TaxID=61149 RepID=A0A2P2J1K9_RHIMU
MVKKATNRLFLSMAQLVL